MPVCSFSKKGNIAWGSAARPHAAAAFREGREARPDTQGDSQAQCEYPRFPFFRLLGFEDLKPAEPLRGAR